MTEVLKKYKLGGENPVTVSQYIGFLNEVLKRISARVVGEVTEVKEDSRGHVWFSLGDKEEESTLGCVIWKSTYRMCGVKIEEGMEVVVSGYADVYPLRGTLKFKAETVELVGEGALKKAYEKLKEKLTKEGLFDKEVKRAIPRYPQKIGVITSVKGAAIHDFTSNLGKFGFKVYMCDSRVEGQEAVTDLLHSLKIMKEIRPDVLVITRGGGSLQSLMAFDNEMLVRKIRSFPAPVIAGIGHHEDITLAALAADVSESTPTAAAVRLSEGFREAKETVSLYQSKIEEIFKETLYGKKEKINRYVETVRDFFQKTIEEYKASEERIKRIVFNADYWIKTGEEKIKRDAKEINFSFDLAVQNIKKEIRRNEEVILANNPEKQLRLGYAIMKKEGKVVKSVKALKKGDRVETVVSDGKAGSEIKKITHFSSRKNNYKQ